jgi:hypothetical protein
MVVYVAAVQYNNHMQRDNLYTTKRFPYSEILFELSERGSDRYIHPVEAYEMFLKACSKLNLLPCPDYFSTSVTSGGVARITGVSYKDTVVRNAAISHRTMETLALSGAIDPHRSILPTDISAHHLLKDWQQKEYITFWHLVISGIRPRSFRKLRTALDKAYTACEVDIDLLNNSKAAPSARAPQHYRLTSAVIRAARSVSCAPPLPVNRVISLNDVDRSLGCRAERDLAGRLLIPSCDIQAGKGLTSDDKWIDSLGNISGDVRAIIKAGGRLSLLRPGDLFSIIYVPEVFGETDTHLRAADLRDISAVKTALQSSQRCASSEADKVFGRDGMTRYINPLSSVSLAMSVHNSDGVNGALLENGLIDFVTCDYSSAVDALNLVVRPAKRRHNQPPIIISAKVDDSQTEKALIDVGLQQIGGNLWSLAN